MIPWWKSRKYPAGLRTVSSLSRSLYAAAVRALVCSHLPQNSARLVMNYHTDTPRSYYKISIFDSDGARIPGIFMSGNRPLRMYLILPCRASFILGQIRLLNATVSAAANSSGLQPSTISLFCAALEKPSRFSHYRVKNPKAWLCGFTKAVVTKQSGTEPSPLHSEQDNVKTCTAHSYAIKPL